MAPEWIKTSTMRTKIAKSANTDEEIGPAEMTPIDGIFAAGFFGATCEPKHMLRSILRGNVYERWVGVRMNHAKEAHSSVQVLFGVVLFFVAGHLCAQRAPVESSSQPRGEATQVWNQRLEDSRKALSLTSSEATIVESRIGADDLLEITVFEAPELNRSLRVSANGEISLQPLGAVRTANLTPRELELVLQELLRRTYMKDPHVGVFVRELQSHPVSVVGAVKKPGVFQIRGTKTVLELLSMAEGLADDAGDTVLVMRGASFSGSSGKDSPAAGDAMLAEGPAGLAEQKGTGEIVEVNLKSLLESVDPSFNIPVHPGDIVKVARAGIVYVVGEVKKPGGFVLKSNENISVLQALALAEGLTRTSSKSQVRIIRTDQSTDKRVEIAVDLGKILASKAPDPLLQPKDILFIPDSSAKSAFYRGAEAVLSTATGVVIYRR
jgi:polysaccharide export outer membrane protein